MSEVLGLERVARTYIQGGAKLAILKGASLSLAAGEIVALLGPSGAGKSTLLHIAGLLERPDGGEVVIAGRRCGGLGDGQRTALRRRRLGFVYQFHHLLAEFSALENVMLPQMIAGRTKRAARAHARVLLQTLGLGERLDHRPARLSGGEQQRVAIARAIANGPQLLLADEPTGNLDSQTAERVFSELMALVRAHQLGALVATHNAELARRMDRIVTLADGALVAGERAYTPLAALEGLAPAESAKAAPAVDANP